jgi:hypothetical protein
MKQRAIRGLCATFVLMSGSAFAEGTTKLAGDKLRKAISGKTLYMQTPIGAEIPIRYRADGRIQASTSSALAVLGGESVSFDTGQWWVVREQLCQQWKNWMDSRSYCYRFQITGTEIRWERNDGATGTARLSAQ